MSQADRRPLSDALRIDGALSIVVVDRLAQSTIWTASLLAGGDSVRVAEDVVRTIRAIELLFPVREAAAWFEVIMIGDDRYQMLRPYGAVGDGLVVELTLDLRSANLAVARLEFEALLATHLSVDRPPQTRATASGLPKRTPSAAVPPAPAAGVGESLLHRVLNALRSLP